MSALLTGFLLTDGPSVKAQSASFSYTGAVQTFTVPCTDSITITATGGQGGDAGGLGAEIQGTFKVTPGTVLDILVAQQGTLGSYGSNGGGGGGSFVWVKSDTMLLIAAGGGGGYSSNGGYPPGNGSADSIPTAGGGAGSGTPGVGGNGGGYGTGDPTYAVGGGGAGWHSNGGTNPGSYGEGIGGGGYFPFDPTYPGAGGPQGNSQGGPGGYGGGGGSSGGSGASGGGGGYNGGGGGNAWSGSQWGSGGGGGSYNGGKSQVNTAAFQSGDGTVTITWTTPATLANTASVINNVMCNGSNSGEAVATATGGVTPYTFAWAPSGGTTDTATGLTAGSYTLTLTDACGNTATASVTITQPTAISLTSSFTSDTGNCNGTAMVTASGGVPPYKYTWTGGGTTDSISGKCAGTYCCFVTDSNGCGDSVCVVITSTAGVQNISNVSSIRVYPDPSNGVFTISGLKNGQVVELYNYMGQQVSRTVNTTGNVMHFDVSGMVDGIYLLKIDNRDGSFVAEKKIMKIE